MCTILFDIAIVVQRSLSVGYVFELQVIRVNSRVISTIPYKGVEYLVQKKIKMAGIDDTVFVENSEFRGKIFEKYHTHDLLLSNDIPLIEGLTNLSELRKKRFIFIGIPAKMGGLESFPIRAVPIEVPIEEKD